VLWVRVTPLDGELALASHWVVMDSLKQFLSLAVQNAEETPDVILYSLIAACVVLTLAARLS